VTLGGSGSAWNWEGAATQVVLNKKKRKIAVKTLKCGHQKVKWSIHFKRRLCGWQSRGKLKRNMLSKKKVGDNQENCHRYESREVGPRQKCHHVTYP